MPIYNVCVKMSGEDGNAFAILGRVRKELLKAGVPAVEVKEFLREATDDDYNHLLRTVVKWVDVE